LPQRFPERPEPLTGLRDPLRGLAEFILGPLQAQAQIVQHPGAQEGLHFPEIALKPLHLLDQIVEAVRAEMAFDLSQGAVDIPQRLAQVAERSAALIDGGADPGQHFLKAEKPFLRFKTEGHHEGPPAKEMGSRRC
jgi:hypothetical protein